jgi:Arc/MetJ-type ribon-helix-helix transcriptional regulator
VSDPRDVPASRFLGVRLSPEEEARLERFRAERKLANRSEAVRSLLLDSGEPRPSFVELPATRLRELEQLVEDGYFTDVAGALEHALEVGLRELVANHGEGFTELRRHARELRERGDRRRRADREGRELLRR